MSAYAYIVADQLVTRKPCKLLSVVVSTRGGGPGIVKVYNSRDAVEADLALYVLCANNQTNQLTFDGMEFAKGLYVSIVEKADYITVEWESIEDDVG